MTRKEEIKNFANNEYKFIGSETDYTSTAAYEGIIKGATWADKTLLDKACEWIKKNINVYAYKLEKEDFPFDYPLTERIVLMDNFDEDFKAAMEE